MSTNVTEALRELSDARDAAPFNEERYRNACQAVIDRRGELQHRVSIEIPGGLTSNKDKRWDAVRAGSETRCSCGNERTILPLNPRTEFEPSTSAPVTVSGGRENGVYLKPQGGDRASTYLMLWISDNKGDKMMAFMSDPFGPLMLNSIFSTPAYSLAQLAEAIAEQGEPLVMTSGKGAQKTPIFSINGADPKGEVTIVLDKDVELLTKEEIETESGHQH